MEGLNVKMGDLAGGIGGLKTNFEPKKSAVGEMLNGDKKDPSAIGQTDLSEARTAQLQQMGLGQKLDATA